MWIIIASNLLFTKEAGNDNSFSGIAQISALPITIISLSICMTMCHMESAGFDIVGYVHDEVIEFKSEHFCTTPHLYESEIQQKFLNAFTRYFGQKEVVIRNCLVCAESAEIAELQKCRKSCVC